MQCPKCNASMQRLTVDGIEVDRCTSCGGLWFDVLEADELKGVSSAGDIDTGSRRTGARQNAKRDITCPKCKATLVKMVALDQPHIQFEQCSTCGGSYFDAGEFEDLTNLTLGEQVRRLLPWRKG